MKALIVGLGSIGRRHLANLRLLAENIDITVWRQHAVRTADPALPTGADRVVYTLKDALAVKPDMAVISSPAPLHVATAIDLARRDVHLMIEKPLSNTLDGVDDLLVLCQRRGLVLLVAYHLRFSESLRAVRQAALNGSIGRIMSIHADVGQFLPEWRPATDYRRGVSARRELGGGVVLELSHDLDYVRWLAGEVQTVAAQIDRLSNLEIDVEDTAAIILRFRSGAIGTVNLDMTRRVMTRSCRLIGSEGVLDWDGQSRRAQLFSATANVWHELHSADSSPSNDMYVAEMQHFLACVQNGAKPLVSGSDGRRALEIALAVKESSQKNCFVDLCTEADGG
jgi:predicted dehydrogenase